MNHLIKTFIHFPQDGEKRVAVITAMKNHILPATTIHYVIKDIFSRIGRGTGKACVHIEHYTTGLTPLLTPDRAVGAMDKLKQFFDL